MSVIFLAHARTMLEGIVKRNRLIEMRPAFYNVSGEQ
jgi:hypothetical protein